MNVIRRVAAALVIAAAAIALHRLCVLPLRCNAEERHLENETLAVFAQRDSSHPPARARMNLASAQECVRVRPHNVNLYMIAALNSRVLGQHNVAIEWYRAALDVDQRPEIYAGLGNAQSQTGDRESAVENLLRANLFWPDTLNSIEDPLVYEEVERRYAEYAEALRRAAGRKRPTLGAS